MYTAQAKVIPSSVFSMPLMCMTMYTCFNGHVHGSLCRSISTNVPGISLHVKFKYDGDYKP